MKISVAKKAFCGDGEWEEDPKCILVGVLYLGFHKWQFVLFLSHIMSEYGRMTDTERDQIDQDAQIFMRTCADAIHQLRTEGKLSNF